MSGERVPYWLKWWFWKPNYWPEDGSGWSLNCGPFALTFERRYYRTTGLQLWLGDRMLMLRRYTPTEEENRELDRRNWLASQERTDDQ